MAAKTSIQEAPHGKETNKPKLVKVESASRPGHVHFLDTENMRCSCPGFSFTGNCKHVETLRPQLFVEPRQDAYHRFYVVVDEAGRQRTGPTLCLITAYEWLAEERAA